MNRIIILTFLLGIILVMPGMNTISISYNEKDLKTYHKIYSLQEVDYLSKQHNLFDYPSQIKEMNLNNQVNTNVNFRSPLNNSIYRAGDIISIEGNLSGDCFKRYHIEYSKGVNTDEWGNQGIDLNNDGLKLVVNGIIATWNTSHIQESDFYTLRITVQYWKSTLFTFLNPLLRFVIYSGFIDDHFSLFDTEEVFYIKNMYFDTTLKQGWPIKLNWDKDNVGAHQGAYWWPGRLMPVVSDVDNDGMKEIFVIQQADPWSIIHGFEADGSYVEGWPQRISYDVEPEDAIPSLTTPTIVDVDGDGFQEVIITVQDGIKIYNHDGTVQDEFQYHVLGQPRTEVPVVDLNHDGGFELIHLHEVWYGDGKYVTVTDLKGNIVGSWPQLYYDARGPNGIYVAGSIYEAIPAVGNFDDDEDLEIVVAGPRNVFDDPDDPHETWHVEGQVIVFNLDGSVLEGFPVDVDGWILQNLAIGDINRDGYDEIVVGSRYSDNPGYSDTGYGLFVINRFGDFCDGWPQLVGEGFGIAHNPSLADVDGDGYLEIIAGTIDSYDTVGMSTYVFNYMGNVLQGWPVETAWYSAVSPTIGDITGDGVCDIVLPAGSGVFPGYEGLGGVYAFHSNGTVIDGFPKVTDLEADATVTIDDIDGDGRVELIGSSNWNRDCYNYIPGTQILKSKHLCEIYVWELDTLYDKNCVEWPRFQHDLWYSGLYSFKQ